MSEYENKKTRRLFLFMKKVTLFYSAPFVYHIDMIKRMIPFAYSDSIFEIEPSFYEKNRIKIVLSDLDNTLDSYKTSYPSERVKELKRFYSEHGIRLMIVSNNTSKRVQIYAQALGVRAICFMLKPFAFRLKKFLTDESLNRDEVLLVGDQIFTDVMAGNKAGVKTLLVAPLTPFDPPWTSMNRFFEGPTRRKLLRKKIAKNWREMQ